MDISRLKNILIIRLSSLGDVLLTTPLVRTIKIMHPDVNIDFLVANSFVDVISHNKYVNRVYAINKGDGIITEHLKETDIQPTDLYGNEYDLILDLQNNFRSAKIRRSFSCPVLKFRKNSWKKFLLVHLKINMLKNASPIPVRYAETLRGLVLDNEGLDLSIPKETLFSIKREDNFIGLCPGAQHFTKRYPSEYFIQLGNLIMKAGYKVAFLGGKSDREICGKLSAELPGSLDLSNDNRLFELAANISNCRAVICNDSGLMHLACATSTPLIAVFGSSVKELGFYPYNNRSVVLENKQLNCRPCSHIGKSKCPNKHFKCMLDITPDLVFKTLNSLLI